SAVTTIICFFFSSRRRHTRSKRDWSSDVCSSDLEARDQGILIRTPEGEPYIAKWWNGYSAVLDFSNPKAVQWLKCQLDALTDMGVDGFKFDAGDSMYYRDDNVTFGRVTPDEQSRLWAEFGEQYPYNEYRASF